MRKISNKIGWLGIAFLVVAVLRLLFGSGWFG